MTRILWSKAKEAGFHVDLLQDQIVYHDYKGHPLVQQQYYTFIVSLY